MEGEADRIERVVGRGPPECLRRVGPLEPELARCSSGRQILVAAPGDVRINPHRDRRHALELTGGGRDLLELLE